MLLRYQPSVMVSSSIRGLEAERAAIRDAVAALSLAESWLFEFDAVAAGRAPDAQYLAKARGCDLFVLIISSTIRNGTEDEYEAAFADNPHKVIPIFLEGEVGNTQVLRDLVMGRHAFRRCASADLAIEVARAVENAVRTGELSRRPLWSSIASQQAALRGLLSLPAGLTISQRLRLSGDRVVDPPSALGELRVLLEGEPGSGKTDAAFTALLGAPSDLLPVACRTRPGQTIVSLVEAALEAVRYTPGPDGIRQLLRDGRLALAFDGLDELSASDRSASLGEIAQAAARFPRAPFIVTLRSTAHPAYATWSRARVEPLGDAEVDRIFSAVGDPGERPAEHLAPLQGLVRLPFWAPAIARHGHTASSGPDVLAGIVRDRLRTTLPEDDLDQERLVSALGFVALRIRPATEATAARLLEVLAQWGQSSNAQARFSAVSGEWVLDHAASSGILHPVEQARQFVHPLIAAYLAARQALELDDPEVGIGDDDLRALIAAMLPTSREVEWPDLLRGTSPAVLVRALRLAGLRPRISDIAGDLQRYERAYQQLAPLAGEIVAGKARGTTSRLLVDRSTVCIKRSPGLDPGIDAEQAFDEWVRAPGSAAATCWPSNPFQSRTPEQLAGEQVIADLKTLWHAINPGGRAWAPFRSDPGALIEPRSTLNVRLLDHARAVADARAHLIDASGLRAWVQEWTGQPEIQLNAAIPEHGLLISWGHPTASVVEVERRQDSAASLTRLLIDTNALAYRELSRDVDALVGGGLGSGSIRPASPTDWSL